MTESVFIVTKNTDMTEGRGPMTFEHCFATFELASDYVLSCSGIMGFHDNKLHKYTGLKDEYWTANARNIREVQILTTIPVSDEQLRAMALRKLTDQEKRALGLH